MTSRGEHSPRPRVAVFRPDDGRLERSMELLESFGLEPIGDPLLDIVPTGDTPRSDADLVILTSSTAADVLEAADWDAGETPICAIGPRTADALKSAGYAVSEVPSRYSSQGIVDLLSGRVGGRRIEIARSGHGSSVLPDGLMSDGAYVHETVLYTLERPAGSGKSIDLLTAGELDAALFTSPLTVEHFVEAATERGRDGEILGDLERCLVGVIGEPTRKRAAASGIGVDVVPAEAGVEQLVEAVAGRLDAGVEDR